MASEKYSFPPYRVKLDHHPHQLQTNVVISGRKSSRITLHALVISAAADVTADQLFIHTANSDHADGASLFSLQLSTGKALWQIPKVTPGGSIVIHPRQKWIDAGQPYGTSDTYVVRVDYQGNIIERNAGSCYEIVDLGKAALEDGASGQAKALFHKALTTSISPNTKAVVHKFLGQIEENEGNVEATIKHYEMALRFNPKAAVNRQLAALQKRRSKPDAD
jgi:tetratricopeptide (TPR) repeat protein